ncbi:replication initiator [Streptomyces qinglanensis]|uniref:replication initiator n=1 Tax=Streptomyces qinglanensis TaxID=943816 RepID=UPI003D7184E3
MTEASEAVAALIERAGRSDFDGWRRSVLRLGGCTNPIHLVGSAAYVDAATGAALHSYTSEALGGRLLVACGNRRATVCPTCAQLYRADTYQLIRAGLVGGKAVAETVSGHPRVFATLTAPSFGPVHSRRERGGRVLACRPRKAGEYCPHGAPVGCHTRHAEDSPRLGEPLCPRCYDYAGAVLWQAQSGELWHRFTLELRRVLARRAGLSSSAVAGYIAKYATKGAESAGAVDGRIRHGKDLATLPVRDHVLRMIGTCWWLGALPSFEELRLRRWAHMLGYRGHFSTKSRHYSTTLGVLRSARAEHREREQRSALGLDDRDAVLVGQWRYAGRGYSPEAALLAASVREGGDGHGH